MNTTQTDAQIKIIMSQTDYNKEIAQKKLQYWNNDFIKVIKEFLNPNFQEKEKQIQTEKNKVVSVNQSIMKELRLFKDKQNKQYDHYKKYRDYLKKEEEIKELNKHLNQQELLKARLKKESERKLDTIDEETPEEIKL
jgi:hypothetical protein